MTSVFGTARLNFGMRATLNIQHLMFTRQIICKARRPKRKKQGAFSTI